MLNTYQWDWTTIAALIAPRPLLFANSDNDPIFPMDGNRRIMAKLRACYKLHAKPRGESANPAGHPMLDEFVSPGGHAYRPDLRIAVFKFLNKYLKADTTTPVEDSAKYTDLPGKQLRVFPTDADLPKNALNGRIDETFVPRAKVALPEKEKFTEWQASLRKRLGGVLHDLPLRVPKLGKLEADEFTWSSETEAGIHISCYSDAVVGAKTKTWVVRNADDDSDVKWFDTWVGRGYAAIMPRSGWGAKSPPNYVARAHALLVRTVDEGKLLDVLATVKHFRGTGRDKIVGRGQAGILAAYAALFEPSIKEVIVIDPPKSHKDGPHFLGILRVLDIPDALGLLAPTPLTIVGGNDPAFERTAEIYRLAGAADKLTRK